VGFLEVRKRSGLLESYSRAKLLRSLLLATDHLSNADATFALADTIETNILAGLPENTTELSSESIAEAVLAVLKRFDARSYVKYLSYQTETLDAVELRKKLVRG
jgi:transcriptional regulator NrdR family protein